jgi:uncharacterized membrane protein YcaP (DUF421 family)
MDLVIRSAVVFCFIFGLTRIIGRRELSSLEPFDLILLIVVGDAIQQGLTQDDYSVTGAVLVIGTLALLQVFTSFLSFKVPRLRPFLEGEPVIIFEDGKPVERNLRRERITVDEIAAQARMQQIESLGDVKWAVLETSGQITFIKKAADGS